MDAAGIFRRRLQQAVKASTIAVAEEAKDHHSYHTKTGFLEKSVSTNFRQSGLTGVIFLDASIAPYGPIVHEGSAPHVISPKTKRALRWPSGGRFIFAKIVYHPGYKGDAFLYRALASKDNEIDAIFDRYVDLAKGDIESAITDR
jgi:hypothetical protein